MWVIINAKGRPTGENVTDEEAAVMILSGEWIKGIVCDRPKCVCKTHPVLFPSPTNETPF